MTYPRFSVLNVVISTPNNREGAVRAGLQLGDHLRKYVSVDTVKMQGNYDEELVTELELSSEFSQIPSKTKVRNVFKRLINSPKNYSNTLIWTRMDTKRNLSDYDIVHIHNPVPLAGMISVAATCLRADLPYCVTTHGISKISDLKETMEMSSLNKLLFEKIYMRLYFGVLKNAIHLFALSRSDATLLQKRFPNQSISVVPNGVRIQEENSEMNVNETQVAEINSFTPLLLFVGKLTRGKGIDDLLNAVERLDQPFTLIIVGPPQDQKYVTALESYGDHIQYLGYVDKPLLNSLYRESDIFVFPTRSDVFPLVTLEAMASKTPVISTNVGGIPEQITDETGYLVEPKNPEALACAISELLDDDILRNKMGEAAQKRVERKYSWDSVAKQTAHQYENLLTKSEDI